MNLRRAALALAAVLALSCEHDGGRATHAATKQAGAAAASSQPSTDRGSTEPAAPSTTELGGDPPLPGIAQPGGPIVGRLAAALTAKGSSYVPRTRHLNADGSPKYTNRLILESSPYLLQHSHNPVNWYSWGDDAFERASREHKPILLSVGYSTCHWCHVMEEESFEDEEIARFLNEHFVAIKVDREERPDVDDVYMQAVQMLSGSGGWPMTLALTAGREPFFGATYIPPRDGVRGARQGFLTILGALAALYERDPQHVADQARELSMRMRDATGAQPAAALPRGEAIYLAASHLARAFDSQWGGFGDAPKFPQPSAHELLLRYFRRTNDPTALHMVVLTLEKMAAGGVYDQIGGGFHRYATDRQWLVPHFEKMLYDNAQLASLYLDAYQIVHRDDFARVVKEILDYVAREMTSPSGGFYSATDADSETPQGRREEGWFFTWTAAEIDTVLGAEDARLVREYYGVTDPGTFHGRNILHVVRPLTDVAAGLGWSADDATTRLAAARAKLYDARAKRPAPGRDDKILTSWNALMISAFARAGFVLDRPDYVERARRAAELILGDTRDPDGRLLRSRKDRAAGADSPKAHAASGPGCSTNARTLGAAGYLDDHAFMIQALLDLYESTWEIRWLDSALELQKVLDEGYLDDAGGGYYMTAKDAEEMLVRRKPTFDWAEPSGNSVAAANLLRLSELTSRDELRTRAEKTLLAFAPLLTQGSPAVPRMLSALETYLDQPIEVVVVGAPGDEETRSVLLRVARALYFPNRILSVPRSAEDLEQQARIIPLLQDKRPLGGRSTAYVCKKHVCDLPTSDAMKFGEQLVTVEPLFEQGEPPPLGLTNRQTEQVP